MAFIRIILVVLSFAFIDKEQVDNFITDSDEFNIIPKPNYIKGSGDIFQLDENTRLYAHTDDEALDHSIRLLQKLIGTSTGFNLEEITDENITSNIISLVVDSNMDINEEGYELEVDKDKISILSKSPKGIFNGVQTLRQLMPTEIESDKVMRNFKWTIPTVTIKDAPEYGYRGAMLDVSRHFFSVEDVKHFVDQIAKYKINMLHLHLSDDQGWRIEIKSWPLLTTIGGSTAVGGGDGGFYTQEQYKDIVAYAQARFITIVPEIDMPGHTNSALAAYGILNPGIKVPEEDSRVADRKTLGVDDEDKDVSPLYTGIKVGFSTLDTKKEITYKFVDDVIRELSEITPGPYIHIGGDESHVTELEDYIPFIERAQEIVSKYGKKTIGWDEVAHAKLKPTSVAQFWAKADNAKMAAEQGAKILMSPSTYAYLDMQYDTTTLIGLHWAAYIEADDAYNWEPTELVEGLGKNQILGVEAPLWTETITNREELEYMVFPRLTAIAEIGWTPQNQRNWESYKTRLNQHTKRWDLMGINYYKSPRLN